jgi:hypothetical protein
MAPDAAGAAAGRKLGKPGPWQGLGESERAFWGECLGSALYQTRVSVRDYASKCTCPSRKFPCKHALGLLFLMAEAPASFATAAEPEWVASWFDKRDVTQQKKQARAEQPAKPADSAAQAKRAQKRHELVLAGLEQLDVWLADLVRAGLGRLASEGAEPFELQARRLVDAQAPGLASRLRRIGTHVGVGDAWAEPVLGELGQLSLLSHAYRRVDALPSLLAHDVRRRVGYTLDQAEVLAHGDVVEDDWSVVSSVSEDDERVRSQRSWLVGAESGRRALILQFAAGPARFAEVLRPGSAFRARLAFWPASVPERAFIAERLADARPGQPPPGRDISAELEEHTTALSRDPWVSRSLFLLDGVAVASGKPWSIIDRAGLALPLRGGSHDVLRALSGGHPLRVAAEWNGAALSPLSAFADGRTVPLTRSEA